MKTTSMTMAALLLAGCGQIGPALHGPNSRTMTLYTLNEQVKPGMSREDVLARLGQPAYTFPLGRQQQTVWNYRFAPPEGDCTVFQVSLGQADGRVAEVGQGYDRYCDGPSRS